MEFRVELQDLASVDDGVMCTPEKLVVSDDAMSSLFEDDRSKKTLSGNLREILSSEPASTEIDLDRSRPKIKAASYE